MRKLIFMLPLLLVGCAQPKTLTLTELYQLKSQRHEPKVSMWYYTGSKDGYLYFHHDDLGADQKDFRVAESELSWPTTFPMTHDRNKWRQLDWGQPN